MLTIDLRGILSLRTLTLLPALLKTSRPTPPPSCSLLVFPAHHVTWWHAVQISDAMGLINIRDRVWHLQPCSAKTGEGLQKGMEWLVANVSK